MLVVSGGQQVLNYEFHERPMFMSDIHDMCEVPLWLIKAVGLPRAFKMILEAQCHWVHECLNRIQTVFFGTWSIQRLVEFISTATAQFLRRKKG